MAVFGPAHMSCSAAGGGAVSSDARTSTACDAARELFVLLPTCDLFSLDAFFCGFFVLFFVLFFVFLLSLYFRPEIQFHFALLLRRFREPTASEQEDMVE